MLSRLGSLVLASWIVLVCGGCVLKSTAEAQARIAYLAGQRDAYMQMQQGAIGLSVTFVGSVANPTVKWSQGLTLSQAIVKAAYNGPGDPTAIVIHRGLQNIETTPAQLLSGSDLPVQAGDVIEIH